VQVLIRFEFDECAQKILDGEKEFFQLVGNSTSEIWNRSAPINLAEIVVSNQYKKYVLYI